MTRPRRHARRQASRWDWPLVVVMIVFIGYAIATLADRGASGQAVLSRWPLVPLASLEIVLWLVSFRDARARRARRVVGGHG